MMNPDLSLLKPYPFARIAELKAGVTPNAELEMVSLAIGEPKHACPDFIHRRIIASLKGFESYPLTKGSTELRRVIAEWLGKRFCLPDGAVNAEDHVLPVNGTREALFAFAQAVVDRKKNAKVLMPNPFYQIYEGAALLAGAEPVYLACLEENGFLPDFDAVPDEIWEDCQLIYLCSPGNPTGAVADDAQLKQLLMLAEKHDFIIASDECYSELYLDENHPPKGLLQVAAEVGNTNFDRCVVFHSLSKRSNVPGLRSGFVAGDKKILEKFLLYRTYHGCAMSPPTQEASIAAWSDEEHVRENRQAYVDKFDAVLEVLQPLMKVKRPTASFYLWPETPIDDETFTRDLFEQQHVNVVPGSYLSRTIDGVNPGKNRVRMALVAPLDECVSAANRIAEYLESLQA